VSSTPEPAGHLTLHLERGCDRTFESGDELVGAEFLTWGQGDHGAALCGAPKPAVLGEGRSMSEVARDHGASRRWVQVPIPMSSGGRGSLTR
jgi:hypothetical protein